MLLVLLFTFSIARAYNCAAGLHLSWSHLVRELGRTPVHERKDLANALAHHPAGLRVRRSTLRRALSEQDEHLHAHLDEILGLPSGELQRAERARFDDANAAEKEELRRFGFHASYEMWFSDRRVLLGLVDYIRAQGIREVVDLGSGVGRLGLLLGVLLPEVRFTGLEIVPERVEAARAAAARLGLSDRVHFVAADLLDESRPLPRADLYFVYGPTVEMQINRAVIDRLREVPGHFHVASQLFMTRIELRWRSWLVSGGETVPTLEVFSTSSANTYDRFGKP